MKREYFKLFSFMIGISLIIASVIFVFSENIKKEKQRQIDEENEIMDEIGSKYKIFTSKAEEFANKHESFIKTIDEDTSYFNVVPDNYNKLIDATKEYEKALTEIDDMDDYLYKNCKNKFYSNGDINRDCLTYIRNKEKMINTFIEDIKYLNHRIESFNEWTEVNNASVIATKQYDKLNEYKSEKYPDYVDLDEDGLLLGAVSD